ncbi:MAG TPA: alpha/beta hydrolase family protein [Terriglobia bacterium]|nr:alpha/beta hydrolase family protein [Terriglobia bacterium]
MMSQHISRRDLLRTMAAAAAVPSAGLPSIALADPPQQEEENPMTRMMAMIDADKNLQWKGSPLGSLYPFIKQTQEVATQSLAFLKVRPKGLEAWKTEVRARIFDLLLYRPASFKPDARVLERVDRGDYIQEYLTFHTTPDVEVGAYFLIPKRAKFPVPGVVALHDHGGFYYWGKEKVIQKDGENPVLTRYRKQYYDSISYPATLARNGYAVIAIDMFYFGERRLVLDSDIKDGINTWSKTESEEAINNINRRNGQQECWVGRNLEDVGITWSGVLCWDDIRTVDYLVSRPEVDPKRIACVGLSVGGWRSNFLAGLDSRIKAATIAGWMTSFHPIGPWWVSYTIPAGNVPGLWKYLDYPDVGSLLMPGAMLVVHGLRDTLFPPDGVKAAFKNLATCYEAIGKPERFKTYTFDGPHSFPARAQQLMLDWFNRWV